MSAKRSSFARLALAIAGMGLGLGILGCDSDLSRKDKEVRQALDAARAAAAAKKPDKTAKETWRQDEHAQIVKAADIAQGASLPTQIHAQMRLGQSAYQLAADLLPTINQHEAAARRLMGEMYAAGAQIASRSMAIAGDEALNPDQAGKGPLATLKQIKAKQEQELAEADQGIKALNASKEELEKQIKDLEAKQADATTRANDAILQSDTKQGQEAVDLYKKGLDARKEAQAFEQELSLKKVDLKLLVGSDKSPGKIKNAQNTRDVIQKAIEGTDKQIKDAEAEWAAVQKRSATSLAEARRLAAGGAGGEGSTPATQRDIAKLAKELQTELSNADAARNRCVAPEGSHLSQAITAFGKAAENASTYDAKEIKPRIKTMPRTSSTPALEGMEPLFDKMAYDLVVAQARYARGALHMRNAKLAELRLLLVEGKDDVAGLRQILTAAKVEVPADLGTPEQLKKAVEEAKKAAEEDFKEAATIAKDLSEREPDRLPWVQPQGRALMVTVSYARSILNKNKDQFKEAQDVLNLMDAKAMEMATEDPSQLQPAAKVSPAWALPPLPAEFTRRLGAVSANIGESVPPPSGTPPTPPVENPTPSADNPDQAAVKTAAVDFAKAAMAGDAAAAKALVMEDPVQQEMAEAMVQSMSGLKKVVEAMSKKWPEKADEMKKGMMSTPMGNPEQMQKSAVTITGDTAMVASPDGKEPPAKMVKVNGQWKIDASFQEGKALDAEAMKQLTEKAKGFAGALNQIAADVESGKLETPEAAGAALLAEAMKMTQKQ